VPLTKTAKPEAGDYLENGERMVYVTGYNNAGSLLVEDCRTGETDTLTTSAAKSWRRVPRRKRGSKR
jgi:hypothetical protein